MRKFYIFCLATFMAVFTNGQVILDFESGEGSTQFQYFGSTLEAELSTIIDNPNPTGVNTSSKVGEFIKPADSEVWAGGFSNPAPPRGLDATNAVQICVDVHMDHIGNLAVKLENSMTESWINTVPNTIENAWETLCFDLSNISEEDNTGDGNLDGPAAGVNWTTLVLFFDFGQAFSEDMTYYFDNVELIGGQLEPVEIEFVVNADGLSDVDSVFVRGTFNNFSTDDNLTDDGNGVWSVTKTLDRGSYEYLFYIKSGDRWETMSSTDECVNVTDDGTGNIFVNRVVNATSDMVLDPVCFGSCYGCGEAVNLTFRLGFDSAIMPSPDGVYLAGGGNFDVPGGRYRMEDADGDNVYEISMERAIGFEGYYTFANGACPDFSCKENIAGQDCADPNSFNDRYLDALTGDTVIETCFMECSETTECTGFTSVNVQFNLNASEINVTSEGVFILGNFTQWQDVEMEDPDGDQIYTASFDLVPGTYEYLYKNGTAEIEQFNEGDDCTLTTVDGPNVFINRVVEIGDGDPSVALQPYCFNSCNDCTTGLNELPEGTYIDIFPTVIHNQVNIRTNLDGLNLRVIAMDGSVKMNQTGLRSGNSAINLDELTSGLYIVHLYNKEIHFTEKIIVEN